MSDEWIAVRLAALCARPDGRVSRLSFHSHAVRTALLIDLASRDRLTRYLQTTSVDTSPTGFAPADRLLAHIDAHPDHTLHRVFNKAPVGMSDVVDPGGLRRSRWRRADDIEPAQVAAEWARVAAAAQGDCDSPATAALTLIAEALRLVAVAEPGSLLGQCGEIAWLVEDSRSYLAQLRGRYDSVAIAGRNGSGG